MMTPMKLLAAAALSLTLVACDEAAAPSFKAAPGQSVDEVVRSLTQTRAIAGFLARACRRQGIALRQPNVSVSLARDIENLKAQGYAERDIEAAFRRANGNKSLIKSAVSYLETRGARRGNIPSVCAVGKAEIAQGTAVGRQLKNV